MKIAFTSCMRIEDKESKDYDDSRKQPVWDDIRREKPDYLFLLGDQIYMDYWPNLGAPATWSVADFKSVMEEKYQEQWNVPTFKTLIEELGYVRSESGGRVYGTWDDHDFGWNNAYGKGDSSSKVVPPEKQEIARRLFRQYMQCGNTDDQEPLYYAIDLKEAGDKVVGRAIFLDTRSHRQEPGDNNDFLGREQLEFLKEQLEYDPALPSPLTLICAGTPMRTGKGWLLYQREYREFIELIGKRHIIYLSGDIHENLFLPPSGDTKLFEIISSGAAVYKYKWVGKRQNYGILDWKPDRIDIKLVDRRGSQSYEIRNTTFEHVEHEPKPADAKIGG